MRFLNVREEHKIDTQLFQQYSLSKEVSIVQRGFHWSQVRNTKMSGYRLGEWGVGVCGGGATWRSHITWASIYIKNALFSHQGWWKRKEQNRSAERACEEDEEPCCFPSVQDDEGTFNLAQQHLIILMNTQPGEALEAERLRPRC